MRLLLRHTEPPLNVAVQLGRPAPATQVLLVLL